MSNGGQKKFIRKEWNKNRRCRICGCVTILPRLSDNGIHVHNTATFGHKYAKTDIRRLLDDRSGQLECYKCNYEKQHKISVSPIYFPGPRSRLHNRTVFSKIKIKIHELENRSI